MFLRDQGGRRGRRGGRQRYDTIVRRLRGSFRHAVASGRGVESTLGGSAGRQPHAPRLDAPETSRATATESRLEFFPQSRGDAEWRASF